MVQYHRLAPFRFFRSISCREEVIATNPTFTAPSMTDILNAATAIFNPFTAVVALAIGVALGARMLSRVVNLF